MAISKYTLTHTHCIYAQLQSHYNLPCQCFRIELESMQALGRGRQELSRHTHALTNFSIDGEFTLYSNFLTAIQPASELCFGQGTGNVII